MSVSTCFATIKSHFAPKIRGMEKGAIPMRSDDIGLLRHYMRAWARFERRWSPDNGYPHAVPYVHLMRPVVAIEQEAEHQDIDDQADGTVCKAIASAVADLPKLQKAAVRLIYLRETGPTVYSNARMSMAQAKALCDAAEQIILPKVRHLF